jgi:hypothetical protein
MTTNRPLRVFLCHSSADKPAVRELYQKLRAESWLEPWLDEEELFPGMDWNLEIEKAIETTDVILVCLSNNSITKEGYVQREIRIALDYADYKPEGTLFIIPVRLEKCEPPRRLRMWQYADFFEEHQERGVTRLLASLRKRSVTLGLKIESNHGFDVNQSHDIESGSPIVQKIITYTNGYSNFDEFFEIKSPSGEFLGEFGLEIPYENPGEKTDALAVWLFDNSLAGTDTKRKVFVADAHKSVKLSKMGELVPIERNLQVWLEGENLQLLATVLEYEVAYLLESSIDYFVKLKVKLSVRYKKHQ